MTPDWIIRIVLKEFGQKTQDMQFSWLMQELECRLSDPQERFSPNVKIYQGGMEIYCKQCKEKILPGQYFNSDPSGYNHWQSKDCLASYKLYGIQHEKAQETETFTKNIRDNSENNREK